MAMSRLLPALVAVAMIGTLAACTTPDAEGGIPNPPSASATAAPAPTPSASVPVVRATPTPPPVPSPEPTALVLPDLGVDMPVDPVGVQADGAMEIPTDPAVAGWYRFGPAPADAAGATVIAAHVDSRVYGLGPLARLRDAQPGQQVSVTDAAGTITTYIVESVTYIPRAQLPVDELFSREGPRSLVVITCGGSFDERTRSYSDNVVLVARGA